MQSKHRAPQPANRARASLSPHLAPHLAPHALLAPCVTRPVRYSPRAAGVSHPPELLPPFDSAELRSLLDSSPVGDAAAERAERAARDTAQRAVSPQQQQQLASPLSVHIASAVDMLQSVRACAPIAPLATYAAKPGAAARRPQSGGAVATQGLSSAGVARVRNAQSQAASPHATGRDGAPLPFRSRLGSAPPGGRRTPSRGSVPRSAGLHSPEPERGAPERVERDSRRPRSAMDVRGPSSFALSQPPLPRPGDRGGFAVRARPRSPLQ